MEEIETRLRALLAAYAVDDIRPADGWVAAQFTESFIEAVPPDRLHGVLSRIVPERWNAGDGLTLTSSSPTRLVGSFGEDLIVTVGQTSEAPALFTGLVFRSRSTRLEDERLKELPWTTDGAASLVAEAACTLAEEHGLVGIVAAQADWSLAGGYIDLDERMAMTRDTTLCAYSVSKIVTTTVTLHLVACGEIDLDRSANHYLDDELRLADDRVTVRHLLSHSGGVVSDFEHFACEVPDQAELLGPVLPVQGTPGETFAYSNAGFGALGRIIALVAGDPFEATAQRVVLDPLGMTSSSFPTTAPTAGYETSGEMAVRAAQVMATIPAGGGLWTTAADLVRLGSGWSTLVPEHLADEALRPQLPQAPAQGLGWRVGKGYIGHAGGGTGFSASLLVGRNDQFATAVLTNRGSIDAEQIAGTLISAAAAGVD